MAKRKPGRLSADMIVPGKRQNGLDFGLDDVRGRPGSPAHEGSSKDPSMATDQGAEHHVPWNEASNAHFAGFVGAQDDTAKVIPFAPPEKGATDPDTEPEPRGRAIKRLSQVLAMTACMLLAAAIYLSLHDKDASLAGAGAQSDAGRNQTAVFGKAEEQLQALQDKDIFVEERSQRWPAASTVSSLPAESAEDEGPLRSVALTGDEDPDLGDGVDRLGTTDAPLGQSDGIARGGLGEVVDFPPFPRRPGPSVGEEPAGGQIQNGLELHLQGVVLSGGVAIALLRPKGGGELLRLRRGERYRGWSVSEITPQAVTFRGDDETLTVELKFDLRRSRPGALGSVNEPASSRDQRRRHDPALQEVKHTQPQ